MKKLIHAYLLVVILSIMFITSTSCHKSSNPITNGRDSIRDNSEGLIPLKVGNKWVFRFYSYDTMGVIRTTFLDSFSVKQDTIIGNERWYRVRGLKPADVDYLDWYTNRSDGVWIKRRYYDTSITYLTFKYPTLNDDAWGNQIYDSSRTISTNVLIQTPAGLNACIQYEDHFQLYPFDGIRNYYYFAAYKGWVQFDIHTSTNSGRLYLRNRQVLVKAILQ